MTDEVKKVKIEGGSEKKASKKDASASLASVYRNLTKHRLEICGHAVNATETFELSKSDLEDKILVSKIERSLELGLLKKI